MELYWEPLVFEVGLWNELLIFDFLLLTWIKLSPYPQVDSFCLYLNNEQLPGAKMKLSNHACSRAQQRGMKPREMQMLLHFGDELPGGSSAKIFCVNSKQTHREIEYIWERNRDFDLKHVIGGYVVVSQDNTVVTIGHRKVRFKT